MDGLIVRARDMEHANSIAAVFADLLSSGDVIFKGEVIEQVDTDLFKILVRGGQEDDRKTEAVCRELSC